MKGYQTKEGYLIAIPSDEGEKTVEVHSLIWTGVIQGLRGQDFFEGDLSSFVEKAAHAKREDVELNLTSEELQELSKHFDLSSDEIQQNNMYWQLAKAVVAKEGSGKYYLANSTRNLFVRDNNLLITKGIIDHFDVIALDEFIRVDEYGDFIYNHYDTFQNSLKAQQNIEKLIDPIKIFEHHEEYEAGDFSNLPSNLEKINK